MAIPEQFSLRWNDFHSNLSQSFQTFLAGEDLVDVTLAADGQYVHAHKLILSVCSPYFKELFKMNPCEHPIVFLKDVSRVELHQLLQFMYRGEVHVRQHELPAFLHTAELLQVKGLTASHERSESPVTTNAGAGADAAAGVEADEDVIDQKPLTLAGGEGAEWGEELTDAHPHLHHSHIALADEPRSPLKRLLKNTPNKNNYNVKKKPRPVSDGAAYAENADYASDSEPLIDFDNDFKMIHHHSVLVLPKSTKEASWNCKSGGVKCPSCHRMFANRYNLKVHIRDKHDTREGTLQCAVCHKRMRNPSCLRVHMYHHRKQAAYLAQLAPPHHHLERLVQGMVGGAAPDWCEPVPDDPAMAPATPAANQNRASAPESVAVKSENCATTESAVIDNGAEVAPRREDVSEPE